MAQKRRVLVVEDDPGTIDLLGQIVERAGYRPVLARSGRQALRLLQERGVDLVLLDLMMKEMDGWTLLESIKADERFSGLPVLIISAKHPREDPKRTKAHADMFEDYFVKPFEVDKLVARMAEFLE